MLSFFAKNSIDRSDMPGLETFGVEFAEFFDIFIFSHQAWCLGLGNALGVVDI